MAAQQRGGETRYRLLETVRQYGAEKLDEAEEEPEIRHANFFLLFAEEVEPELKGSQQVLWVQRLSSEYDNLRTAMRWLLEEEEYERVARLG